jgi:hypothetical protein
VYFVATRALRSEEAALLARRLPLPQALRPAAG